MTTIRALVVALCLLVPTYAAGANLASGVLSGASGDIITCAVTNVGTKPIDAPVVQLKTEEGNDMELADTCDDADELEAGTTCFARNSAGPSQAGYCTVSVKGTIRAVLIVVKPDGTTVASLPLTK